MKLRSRVFKSLRMRIIFLFSLIVALLLIITQIISVHQLQKLAKDVGVKTAQSYVTQTINSLDIYLYDIKNMARNIMAEKTVQDALDQRKSIQGTNTGIYYLFRELEEVYSNYTNTRTHVLKVYIVNVDGKFIDSHLYNASEDIQNSNWFQSLGFGNNNESYSTIHVQNYSDSMTSVFSYQHPIYSVIGPQHIVGYLVVDIDTSILRRIFLAGLSIPNRSLFLLNSQNSPMYMENANIVSLSELMSSPITSNEPSYVSIRNKNYVVLQHTSDISNWKLITAIPMAELGMNRGYSTSLIIAYSILSILIIIIVSSWLVRKSFQPVINVTKAMECASKGDLEIQVLPSDQTETQALIDGFNSMVQHIRRLLERVSLEERRKKDLEIYVLKAQVSPHFLYNSLNSVRYLARSNRTDDVQTVVTSLIYLLQASYERVKFVSISREMTLVRDYIKIQKLRYDMELLWYEEVDEDTQNCAIPGFSIQPIVENALFHGLVPNDGGEIRTVIKHIGDNVIITINDNGIGMNENIMSELNRNFLHEVDNQDEYWKFTRIGLLNVNSRIHHLFSYEYGLSITSKPGEGTCVLMKIPYQKLINIDDGGMHNAENIDR